ncbi:Zn(2)-C6 fungal-type DNA-binding domain [Lasallia pustulata]|uniref:Zn(2)-C6 fungal-type DNA-binding domain n=1 Tax=Lasallia pustulata TaxID=136370 RepID=A0A1W5CWF4_9LECA|nr:Zn(2)-C6 fungal-type DNA-binding domain [Lasallia pustulata]
MTQSESEHPETAMEANGSRATEPTSSATNQPNSPRKRRRKAPATGAAADCFACQDRHAKCDRRRPYCTQCLDQGKDCSGYKTTLTWGMGVASRGKLRGLALPIAKSRKVDQEKKQSKEIKKESIRRQSYPASSTSDAPDKQSISAPKDLLGNASNMAYGFVNMDASSATDSPMMPPPNLGWRASLPQGQTAYPQPLRRSSPKRRLRRRPLQPLHLPAPHMFVDMRMPLSAGDMGSYEEPRLSSSLDYSPMATVFQSYTAPLPLNKELYSHELATPSESSFFGSHESQPWPQGGISSSLSSESSGDFQEEDGFFADPVIVGTLDGMLSHPSMPDSHDPDADTGEPFPMEGVNYTRDEAAPMPLVVSDVAPSPSLAISQPLPSPPIGATPGLQFLINYYDKVISPVIVAFDGPTNPYRSHILRLAVESETLQHAIAALSASNLRMRRGHGPSGSARIRQLSLQDSNAESSYENAVRKSSIAHSMMEDHPTRQNSTSTTDEPSQEELHHKGASIRLLNEQLADSSRRSDDSILATLLILCLYHICDTGVAKFKTQFAGVKKLLALRSNTIGRDTKETNWLATMFTWFDAMTATVNDREGQMHEEHLFGSVLEGEEWALENLAGCDGKLFKIIAKLGRLNLLSQGKNVVDPSASPTTKPLPQPPPNTIKPAPKTPDYYSMKPPRFDGNGWGPLPDDDDLLTEPTDPRTQFWEEWSAIRSALQAWELDSSMPAPLCSATLQVHRRDLLNISESFRYAALLYTERLAYPGLPSSHPNFQNLVAQALYYISNVKADVYLLWPLFITGTECVDEVHRSMIRQRCLDIQRDSGFFNNISGLQLLEKIWRDDAGGVEERDSAAGCAAEEEMMPVRGGGFKWRKVMEKVDGEYIVI